MRLRRRNRSSPHQSSVEGGPVARSRSTRASNPGATRFFVSYSGDDEQLIEPLVQLLRVSSKVFWANDTIEPGERWAERIESAVRASDCLVLFWCCHGRDSDWVAQEISWASESDVRIVPALLCQCPAPSSIQPLQWIDFSESVGHRCRDDKRHSLPPASQIGAAALLRSKGIQRGHRLQRTEASAGWQQVLSREGPRARFFRRERMTSRLLAAALLLLALLQVFGAASPFVAILVPLVLVTLETFWQSMTEVRLRQMLEAADLRTLEMALAIDASLSQQECDREDAR
jgi:hypothetical protein